MAYQINLGGHIFDVSTEEVSVDVTGLNIFPLRQFRINERHFLHFRCHFPKEIETIVYYHAEIIKGFGDRQILEGGFIGAFKNELDPRRIAAHIVDFMLCGWPVTDIIWPRIP